MRYDRNTSLLAGMSDVDLRTYLAALQRALIELGAGKAVTNVQVTGGGQHRSVTYTAGDSGHIVWLIRLVQAQLGIIDGPRCSAGVSFR